MMGVNFPGVIFLSTKIVWLELTLNFRVPNERLHGTYSQLRSSIIVIVGK